MRSFLHSSSVSGIFKILFLSLTVAIGVVPALQAKPEKQRVRVVSSAADQVSGGDARIEISTNGNAYKAQIQVLVNGYDQSGHFVAIDKDTLSGVVDNLSAGSNTVVVNETRSRGNGRPGKIINSDSLELINYPISGPIFSGEHQKAFVCTVQNHGLGQPLPDSSGDSGPGWPVYGASGDIVGRSTTCQVEPTVTYRYRTTGGDWAEFIPGDQPADLATTTTIDGDTVAYIVRWERGVINRFIYSMAMLDSDPSPDYSSRADDWNGRLLYHFQGGVAIGHTQGSPSTSRMLYDNALKLGYGVIYSTGTKTGTHYDLELGAETALMTKERFIEVYGVPLYTVSVGGSGGGIQQYVYGQNLDDRLIDAAIPQYSYPDMVTQTIHISDCELLEFYMDYISQVDPASSWSTWSNRTWLIGLNAEDGIPNP